MADEQPVLTISECTSLYEKIPGFMPETSPVAVQDDGPQKRKVSKPDMRSCQ
jgi:hypothetical protein